MARTDKPLAWLRGEVKTPPFSKEARVEAGFLLRQLQQGVRLSLPHSRPMPSIGQRCHELRIPDEDATWRIVYRLDKDAVVIADVLAKSHAQDVQTCDRDLPAALPGVRRGCRRKGGGLMNKRKQQNLEAKGWKVGSAAEFLGLSAEEQALIDLKLALAAAVRVQRRARKMTQGALAKVLHSSQSRVAKLEAGDPSVSTDLLFRSLFALKTKSSLIAKAVERRKLRVAV